MMTHQTDLCVSCFFFVWCNSCVVVSAWRRAVGRPRPLKGGRPSWGVTTVVVGLFVAHGSRSWADQYTARSHRQVFIIQYLCIPTRDTEWWTAYYVEYNIFSCWEMNNSSVVIFGVTRTVRQHTLLFLPEE